MSLELNDGDLLKSQAFIDGEWCDSNSGDSFDVSNPATGDVITAVASCGTEETRHAIEVADRALGSWRQTTAKERARLLRRWFDLMMEAQVEPRLRDSAPPDELGTPDILLMVSEEVLVFDNLAGTLRIVGNADPAVAGALDGVESIVKDREGRA